MTGEFLFALFEGDYYYPGGGWEDFRACYQTAEDATDGCQPAKYQWAHVVDLRTLSVVARAEGGAEWRFLGAARAE